MISLVETVKPYINHYGYWAVLVGVFFESLGLPLPGETLIIVAGLAAAKGVLNVTWVIVLAVIATFCSNNVSYAAGYFGGRGFVLKYGKYVFINEQRLTSLENFFKEHGGKVIVVARFIIGMRQFNGFIAGTVKMPFAKFALFNFIGAFLWVSWWAGISYYFGRKFDSVFVKYYLLIGIFGLLALIFIAFRFSKKTHENPLI
jgi:membrane protein DedA with SNARE-associated domain